MVIAVGLSPAWQTVLRFGMLVPGAVNRADTVVRCASGKVINVAVALRSLGCPSRAVTLLGGATGAAVKADCAAIGVDLLAVPTAAETRVCTTLLDGATGRTTELVENAAPVAPAEIARFVAAVAAARSAATVTVVSGSIPAGVPASIHHDLLIGSGGDAVLDTRGAELLSALPVRPLLVKPNREELARTAGRALDDDAAVLGVMEELIQRGARWVLVTDGPRPALLSGPDGIARRVVPPRPDRIENPIGSGDCLAAGFAAAIHSGRPPLEAIVHGIACAADNCRTLHAGRLDPVAVTRLEAGVTVEEL